MTLTLNIIILYQIKRNEDNIHKLSRRRPGRRFPISIPLDFQCDIMITANPDNGSIEGRLPGRMVPIRT